MDEESLAQSLQAQFEEIEVMQSIYGKAWHVEQGTGTSNSFGVDVPENDILVTLHVTLPQSYPLHSPPVYDLFAPSLSTQQKNLLGAKLDDVYLENIGQSVLYQWVETIRDFILNISRERTQNATKDSFSSQIRSCDRDSATEAIQEDVYEEANACLLSAVYQSELSKLDRKVQNSTQVISSVEEIEIIHGDVITDRKSAFQGHLARIHSVEQVNAVLSILRGNKKISNATHNMYAYRISLPNSVVIQDCEDDGETQAGSRMLHLLQIMDVTNLLVVVSRW